MFEAFNYSLDFLSEAQFFESVATDKANLLVEDLITDLDKDVEVDDEYARNFWLDAREEIGDTIHGFFLWLFAPWIATAFVGYFAYKFSFKSAGLIDDMLAKYVFPRGNTNGLS